MTRLARAASAAALLALVLLVPTGAAHAQSVDAAAGDLQDNDVTFEDGALTDDDLEDLDRVVAQLQSDGGYFKVVVLASPTDEFSSTRAYAEEVRDALGGTGESWSSIRRTSASPPTSPASRRASTTPRWRRSRPRTARTPSPPGCWRPPTSSGVKGSGGPGTRLRKRRRRRSDRRRRELEREHPAPRPAAGLRGSGRLRLLHLVVVPQEEGVAAALAGVAGRGRAEGAQRGRADVQPGARAGRQGRAAGRAEGRRRPLSAMVPPASPTSRTIWKRRTPARSSKRSTPAWCRPAGSCSARQRCSTASRRPRSRLPDRSSRFLRPHRPGPLFPRRHRSPTTSSTARRARGSPTPPSRPSRCWPPAGSAAPWAAATGGSRATMTGSATTTAAEAVASVAAAERGAEGAPEVRVPASAWAPAEVGAWGAGDGGPNSDPRRDDGNRERTTNVFKKWWNYIKAWFTKKSNEVMDPEIEIEQAIQDAQTQGPAAPQPGRPGHRPPHPGGR